MKVSAVQISDLSFSYENLPVLEKINCEITRGSFVGIMGPNGGGKTTLLKLLMGFLQPGRGRVRIFGQPPSSVLTRIGYVPQFHRTDRDFPITVLELVLLGALSKTTFWGFYPPAIKEKAESLIEELGLAAYMKKPFSSLSGGLAQRALLARSLLSDPDLLLLDEPMANIDLPSSRAILNRLQELRGKKTVLLVTHDLETVLERIDRVLCIQTGLTSYLPEEVCEHFALGLYHTPLLEISEKTHKKKRSHVPEPILS
jgi:zinc transport system ATP-binding protein